MMQSTYPLLNTINYPSDLRKLKECQLEQLCVELRQFLIDELSCNPGHFGSSLGVVELTVALHYVFETPHDRIVWDVGHQAYGHKILTGRRNVFKTNRKFNGISGFPSPKESQYDSFVAGHASTSISAGLGMSIADAMLGEKRQVIAVIGDGSLTGGLAFEGLNNASVSPNNLLIVLNDNNMSIDKNVGGLSQYLMEITTSRTYNRIRYKVYRAFEKIGLMNESKRKSLLRFSNSIKNLLIGGNQNIFESLSIRYFGQVDGHDVLQLVKILNDIKDFKGPKVLHIKTKKGKGFAPAENAATEWHAPGLFNKETGERIVNTTKGTKEPPLYQDVFGETLLELAKVNDKIVGVTPAMPTGCSMNILMKEMPDRAFDVGIAEGHAVTFSAGLAKEGLLPFCNVYSSFMQRAYDQVIHDVALQNLNVVFCLDRAGLVGADGPTHHGNFDLAYFRVVPNLTIASPINEEELRNMMYTAQLPNKGPFVIRYPRGNGVLVDWQTPMKELPIGKGVCLKEGKDIAVLSIGNIGNTVAKAIELLGSDSKKVAHYDMRFLKPIDEEMLHDIASKFKKVITVENGTIKGGLGSAVLEFFADNNYLLSVTRLGLPDEFIQHGSNDELFKMLRLDDQGIAQSLRLLV
ncbi:MAG: 1-deoxy-D-xylulose-5-phosphate synthase [Bacteroidales bacterium]|nr:1-deoxy-D-xylulose-5-phosphate synthase [Paludibacteraceae bacterium]MBP8627608.1 1-deoxy-D-xylulose-5-phosphate synthase [Paludibacteraceae bacterium]NLK92328.1 1-deoxy-D-xylulose-5-phosphate synthase [Bacteroidales bacterium]